MTSLEVNEQSSHNSDTISFTYVEVLPTHVGRMMCKIGGVPL